MHLIPCELHAGESALQTLACKVPQTGNTASEQLTLELHTCCSGAHLQGGKALTWARSAAMREGSKAVLGPCG